MSRYFLPLLLVALCAAGVWGCGATSNLISGKPWNKRGRASDPLYADNPLRERSNARRAGASADSPESLAKKTGKETPAKPDRLARFDEETLALIEEELAATPPEERDQFYNDVISLEPAMVRQIIHTRRIVRQVGQDAPSSRLAAAQPSAETTGAGLRQVSGEQVAQGPAPPIDPSQNILGRNPARDPGLGAIDPWKRETQAEEPGWTNNPNQPPDPLPFNQIPSISATGHSAGYNSGELNADGNPVEIDPGQMFVQQQRQKAPTGIQPPPGGAQSPVTNFQDAVSALPSTPRRHRNARVPGDYNPQVPPVPDYGQGGADPFASQAAVRIASGNPNQQLPGSLGVAESFGQDANAMGASVGEEFAQNADLARLIGSVEMQLAGLRYSDQTGPAEKTAYIQKHVYLRMLYLMAGQEARAVTAIPDIPPADQEFWQQTFWAMSNYFDVNAMPDNEYRATQTIAQLRRAIQKLQENARLELRNVAFCHKISSFGNFDRFPQDEFGPGQPVLVYAEVANFKSEPTTLPNKPDETYYRTMLKSSIEIHRLGPSGELVERFDFEPTEDLCRNPRKDYFHSYEFTIPQRISLGPHVMTLTVEDQLNRKVATYRLNFMVK